MRTQEIVGVIQAALECSIYHAPTEPGLTWDEIVQCVRHLGYDDGEIADALRSLSQQREGKRYLPTHHQVMGFFYEHTEPDYRNLDAIDFIFRAMRDIARKEGIARARIARAVMVERAAAAGFSRMQAEASVTLMVVATLLKEHEGTIMFPGTWSDERTPADVARHSQGANVTVREKFAKLYPVVHDVIDRRTDGRPAHAEPFDAFADRLQTLGYGHMRLWWTQMVRELKRLDVALNPVAACVLSAALVEGALAFIVKFARENGLRVFQSKDFDGSPRTWKIDDLVASATSGGNDAVLDPATRARADALIAARQRIHAGRMLVDHPQGTPDLRPDEARDALSSAEAVVRKVLDWLDKHAVKKP